MFFFIIIIILLKATLKELRRNNNNNNNYENKVTWPSTFFRLIQTQIPNHLIISEPTVILSDQSINFAGDPSRSNYKRQVFKNMNIQIKIHLAWLFSFLLFAFFHHIHKIIIQYQVLCWVPKHILPKQNKRMFSLYCSFIFWPFEWSTKNKIKIKQNYSTPNTHIKHQSH